MAYGTWLYKEINTSNGVKRLEIRKRNYTGSTIEISALADDSLVLSMDGGEVTDPIIGTSLSFSIIDTGQFDTMLLFTPDATLYQVNLYNDGVLIWTGHLTPDSYTESLVYRDTIALTARDNLGRLNDFTYDGDGGLQNIVTLINDLCTEAGVSLSIVWSADKVATIVGGTAEDTTLITAVTDIYVDTMLFTGWTYREIVEEILHSLGCQMRYKGNNQLVVLDISKLYDITSKSLIFVNKSGVQEIRPAWKEVTAEQDYGLVENFFDGYIPEDKAGSSTFFKPSEQMPDKWEGEALFSNQYGWNNDIEDDQNESIFIQLAGNFIQAFAGGRAIYKKRVKASNATLTLKMDINNTLRYLRSFEYHWTNNLFPGGAATSDDNITAYELIYHFNIGLRTANGTIYAMSSGAWVQSSSLVDLATRIMFRMPECQLADEGTWNKDTECTITINSIPYDGELLVIFLPVAWEETLSGNFRNYSFYGKIKNISLSFNNNIGGKSARVMVDDKHNVSSSLEFKLGQVPRGKGNDLAYAGGFYNDASLPISAWKLNTSDIISYQLLELVTREHIHHNIANYPMLSGTMMGQGAITLGENVSYKGSIYAIISASLNILSNTLNVTKMQKVVPYQVAELTVIDSPLESSSGTRLGSGDNEVIQFSNDAGNAKRIYELDSATDEDKEESYVIIDKGSLESARRIPLTDVGGLWKKDANGDVYLIDNNGESRGVYGIGVLRMGTLILPNASGTEGDYELYVGALGAGSDVPSGGGGIAQVTINVNGSPYKTDANGVVTLPNYPTIPTWNTLEGKPTFAAVATSGAYSDLSGTPNLGSLAYKSSLVASDIPDLSGSYLPKSGGTIDSTNGVPLIINTSNSTEVVLQLSQNGQLRAIVGYDIYNGSYIQNGINNRFMGIANDGTPYYHNGSYKDTLIHSGNIGSYALKIDGSNAMNSNSGIRWENDLGYDNLVLGLRTYMSSPNTSLSGLMTSDWGTVLHIGNNTANYAFQLASSVNAEALYYRGYYANNYAWNSWKTIAFTDSNVASATKLQTTRTIWGQSFDGTGDVNGYMDVYGPAMFNNYNATGNNPGASIIINKSGDYFGLGPSSANAANMAFGLCNSSWGWSSEQVVITNTGNILIGDTNDIGYKLYVAGNISASTEIRNDTSMSTFSAYQLRFNGNTCGLYRDSRISGSDASRLWLYNAYNLAIYGSTIELHSNAWIAGSFSASGNISANGIQLPTSVPSNPVSGGYYLYVGSLGAGATIS